MVYHVRFHRETPPMESCPPLPRFIGDTARQKMRATEDAWNTSDPALVALAYTSSSICRNRARSFSGRWVV